MHRMRRFVVFCGTAVFAALAAAPAHGSLLRPAAGRAYPDIAGDINGRVTYTYDPVSKTGVFEVTNTPYLIAGGASSSLEYGVTSDAISGVRSQLLRVTLDSEGKPAANVGNVYEMWGTIVAEGVTYSGLLLKGLPTSFGFQDLGPVGIEGSDVFDVNLSITGGALAQFFGTDAYMRITPELASTFTGRFDESFAAEKATSNTRTYASPLPFPIPEPASVVVLLAGVAGLALRFRGNRRRLA